MTTLKDISSELGLSVTTVSRALNGFPEVSARTRAQVQETARRMGYRPNRVAQRLQSGRSGLVGMIVRPDPQSPADRSFVEVMYGLSQELAQHELDLVFQVDVGTDPVAPYRRLVEMHSVDGFILNAPEEDDPRIAFLQDAKVPFVVHGRDRPDADYAYFDIDNVHAAASAVDLLCDLGHQRVALLNGPAGRAFARDRRAGFSAALAQRGFALPPAFVAHDDQTPDFGYRAALPMLSGRYGKPPTAVVCASTLIAESLYRAAADLGLAIPGDLSVVAHDDAVPEVRAISFSPALTVTQAPLREACGPLARLLIGILNGGAADQDTARATLILRGSTAQPPQKERMPWPPTR